MTKNILIIHYNTPKMTEHLVKSIDKYTPGCTIYIFDNSDKLPFTYKKDNIKLIDNTKGQVIDFNKWLQNFPNRIKSVGRNNFYASAKHCVSVLRCMQIIKEPFVLLDSDVLLTRDITDLFDEKYIFISPILTVFPKSPRSKPRSVPYVCYINVPMCTKYNIHYFDSFRMHGLYNLSHHKDAEFYDTGAAFLFHCKKNNLPYKEIKAEDYIVHYGAGSWSLIKKKNPLTPDLWLLKYKKYWSNEKTTEVKPQEKPEEKLEVKPEVKPQEKPEEKLEDLPQDNSIREVPLKKVVYTCITGNYENSILDDPILVSKGFDYVCFTDNPKSVTGNIWKVRPIPEELSELSNVKKQRVIKICPHKYLSEYELSVWIDGSVYLGKDLNEYVLKECSEKDISVYIPLHPNRKCIYEEMQACITMKKDTKENINKQKQAYLKEKFPRNQGLVLSNIIIRYHMREDCITLMNEWKDLLVKYSHRDLLSFNYCMWKHRDIKVKMLSKTLCKTLFFMWDNLHGKLERRKNNIINTLKKNLRNS